MIATHDSYTYLSSNIKAYNLATGPWKTNNISIQAQYNLGVRYFDIRVRREEVSGKMMWRVCHGVVGLNFVFINIRSICTYFESFKGSFYRIILESGDENDKNIFSCEVFDIKDKYEHFHWCVIKDGWDTLFVKPFNLRIVDYCCKMNTAKEVLGMLKYGLSIKKWAEENNPLITQEMKEDKNTVYFYDFFNI